MRSDYGLYGIAIICFIIAGAFMANLVPGYTLVEAPGITVIIIFVLIGIISAAVGYSARPKEMMPALQPTPTPPTPAQEIPPPAPSLAEEMPPTPPPTPPAPAEEVTPEPAPPPPMPTEPSPPTVAPPLEQEQPVKAAEEEKPKEKPVRRRRKKAQ